MSSHNNLLVIIYDYLSIGSLTISMIALIPQIILIHYNKSFQNLSLSFILILFLQDLLNIFFLSSSPSSIQPSPPPSSGNGTTTTTTSIVSLYYCFLDLVLLSQYYYYHHHVYTTTHHRNSNHALIASATIPTILSNTVDAHPIPMNTTDTGSSQVTTPAYSLQSLINFGLSFSSRLPQIYYNYKYKSTKGVSIYLFICTFISSIFHTIAICINIYLSVLYSQHDVNNNQIVLLTTTICMIILDGIILIQFKLYKQTTGSGNSRVLHQPPRTRAPSWYTRNQFSYHSLVEDEDNDEDNNNQDNYNPVLVPHHSHTPTIDAQISPNERSSLISSNTHTHYYSYLTSPPSHYILSSQASSPSSSRPPIESSTSWNNQLMQRISRSMRRQSSTGGDPVINIGASSPTNLIPSIVGTMSNVNKKMHDEMKIPFSPIDFLNDEFYGSAPTSIKSNNNNSNHV
ncbi:uncharacterized protein J8A68_002336 [[Candida] subhashii]|uniref:Uncharacterized protein n=1 Tax=[Candida] subhashii TaxID=561895 RepID=A0A8J5QL58_9ASCO|nr:uncharacterized protein J8A68_002336 [[Candida] subhashii]KAG7664153.1 hypothetical protein J8A68_002336 [[Candida] subhashii]